MSEHWVSRRHIVVLEEVPTFSPGLSDFFHSPMSENGQPGTTDLKLYFRRFKQQNSFNLRSLGVSQSHPFRYIICVSNKIAVYIYIYKHHRSQ